MVIHIYINLGNISDTELCEKLEILCISFDMEWKEETKSIDKICAYLSKRLEENSKLSDTLFIFDDIWKESHYKYLSFAKKSISTSRFKYEENGLNHHCIRLPKDLTYDEAIELLALPAGKDTAQTLRDNQVVKKVIDSCQGLPLAISLISRLRLKTDEDWNKAKDIIAKKSIKIKLAGYDFNLYGTLQLSVDSLNDEIRQLFEQLAVFKRVSIPIQSIASLWDCEEWEADLHLSEMNNKSLLTYDEEKNFREVRIWKIEGNFIRPTNKQISRQYKIEYCRWVLMQDSVCVLLWWRKYQSQRGKFEDYERDDSEKWINECQIEMWNAQEWTCRSFKVPAFIHDRYIATNQHVLSLTHINIYRDAAYWILSYTSSRSSTIGLLKMEQEFENQIRPIFYDGKVENILVSGDQSMIAIDCDRKVRAKLGYYDIGDQFGSIVDDVDVENISALGDQSMIVNDCSKEVILKMSGDQVQSFVKLDQSGRLMFIPGSNRLLIYGNSLDVNVYEYNLQGDKIAWQDISQTKSVDVGRPQRNPQTTVNIFDLIKFVGIEDCRKYRELINGILEEESTAEDWIRFRYRKKDNTLILMNGFGWLLLLLENGDHTAILNQDGNLRMKRYKDNIEYFDPFTHTQFFNHENLWSDKQLILYENRSSLNIYNPQTLQLQITLPFPHFRIWDMQWNLQHSQLIIRSRKDYCLVTHVKKT
ncbi:uncharacterized protein TRIADDRAFT_62073 [Trichoplax adhaerens]|uniref:NB-ARC domain-containing protein n=1 Tax=Trichoplax adhaerens TaxID=10228 RepID=B3SCR8_TRIAD|nr:predicted protein [Trichoplax adhaerens]EDV19457.1 predicted protein [Trichoplax adhaerens]|eukprot:XP_002118057.1 predicted protein [Trichoplax adhaerens]